MSTLTLKVENLPSHVADFIRNSPHKCPKTVRVHLGNDPKGFGSSWHDYNRTTTYLVRPDDVKVVDGTYYDSILNASSLQQAVYSGKAEAHIEGAQFIACYSSYPGFWDIYLPENALDGIPANSLPELNPGEKVALYVTVSVKSSYRLQEAARYGMGSQSYEKYIASLQSKGLIAKNRAATSEGKVYRDNVLGVAGHGLEDAWRDYVKAGYPGENR